MPPRIRSETPARRDARIRKHLPQAREYWSKCPTYLADGDLCQAGEKGWGAVAQLVKAVAAHRGWQHFSHDEIRAAIRQIAVELPDQAEEIRLGLVASEALHGDFYELVLDRRETEIMLQRLIPLLSALWNELPSEYTGGVPFDDWAASGDN